MADDTYDSLMARGDAAADALKWEEAADSFQKATTLKAEDVDAWYKLGVSLDGVGKRADAIDAYRKAIAIKPDHEGAWNNLGVGLAGLGNRTGAIEAYRTAISIKPDHEGAWYNFGISLYKAGMIADATEAYRNAVAIRPEFEAAWFNLGVSLGDLGKHTEAAEAYRKALAIKPKNEAAWYNLGISLNEIGEYSEAVNACRKAISIKPDNAGSWANLGLSLRSMGKHSYAAMAYRKAIAIKPDDSNFWYDLGVCLYEVGKYSQAIDAIRRSIAITPNYAVAWFSLGKTLLLEGDKEEGEKALCRSDTLDPIQYLVWSRLYLPAGTQAPPSAKAQAPPRIVHDKPLCLVCKGEVSGVQYCCPCCDAVYHVQHTRAIGGCWSCHHPIPELPLLPGDDPYIMSVDDIENALDRVIVVEEIVHKDSMKRIPAIQQETVGTLRNRKRALVGEDVITGAFKELTRLALDLKVSRAEFREAIHKEMVILKAFIVSEFKNLGDEMLDDDIIIDFIQEAKRGPDALGQRIGRNALSKLERGASSTAIQAETSRIIAVLKSTR